MLRFLRADLAAALTIALIGVPQCLAYALVAGLPPAYGLVTGAVPAVLAALIGRTRHVITGPTNTTSLLILGVLTPYLSAATGFLEPHHLPLLVSLTVMSGLLRIVIALLGGAALVRFLPQSVLVGFLAGAALLIAVLQLDEALGMAQVDSRGFFSELRVLQERFAAGERPALLATSVSFLTLTGITLGRRYAPGWPVALMFVAMATLAAWGLDLSAQQGLELVRERADLPVGWPPLALPALDLSLIGQLVGPAIAISLLGILELAVAARAGGHEPDMRREIFAQGIGNTLGALAGAFPASASLTRSAMLRTAQVTSRLPVVLGSLSFVPILLWGGQIVGYIPLASLAGVLMATALRMFEWARVRRMWLVSARTRLLVLATFGATLVLSLEWAVVFGTTLGLVIHLVDASKPRLRMYVVDDAGLHVPGAKETPRTVVIEVSGNMHFAAVPIFKSELLRMLPRSASRIVLDLSHAHQLRYGALEGLEELGAHFKSRGKRFELANVPKEFALLLQRVHSQLPYTMALEQPDARMLRAVRSLDERRRVEQ